MPHTSMPEFSWAFALHQVHTAPVQLIFVNYMFKLELCKEGMVAAKNI